MMYNAHDVKHFKFDFLQVLIYYFHIFSCSWPQDPSGLKVFILADPHLLGPFRGHWLDKLRRYSPLHTYLASSEDIMSEGAVCLATGRNSDRQKGNEEWWCSGDLFDEGQWCDLELLEAYTARFYKIFSVPDTTELWVVPGNHDIGFHYKITSDRESYFRRTFHVDPVSHISRRGVHFVLLNSMAFHGDDCSLCQEAKDSLATTARTLNNSSQSRPIVLQHFPLYRTSDQHCDQADKDPQPLRFKERWDCLSQLASNTILHLLRPRAVFSGHTHYGCLTTHPGNIPEWTVASFSWRNILLPGFLMTTDNWDC
ncbi:MPPE1 [Cordylochernes scorpioides]|uniref:MPPE1 n=1 Tax=Cordylochernes scorpioides TaxID=51811 RepID=A0ABY6KUA0_9ARAC|nr:MPPE1 [Cordylochernes scorpioides]